MLTFENARLIMEKARESAPKEMCGLLVIIDGIETFQLCKNIISEGNGFVLDPKDYAEAEDKGDIIAVVHSHPCGSVNPSNADLAGITASRLPWFIINPFTWEIKHVDYC